MLGFFKNKELQISKLSNDDFYEISQIHKASFTKGWEDGAIAEMLKTPSISGMVARLADKKTIIAFLISRSVAKEAEIITIATAPNARRTGAGKSLMQEFIRESLTNRLTEMFLEVDENNIAAVTLYKSLGFKKVGERQGYYDNSQNNVNLENSNALIMRLDLTA